MTLLLYGVVGEALAPEPELQGVNGSSVTALKGPGLTALISEHDRPPALDEAAMWAYEAVLEYALERGGVVPMRFGTVVSGVGDARRVLAARGARFARELSHVQGAVELSVRGTWAGPNEDDTTSTGTAYMDARLAARRRARELADRVSAQLSPNARDSGVRVLSRPSTPVSAAFLVDRDLQDRFIDRVRDLDAQLADADLTCTGPWPAYSFVGRAADE